MGRSRFARDYEKMTRQQIAGKEMKTDTYIDDMIKSVSQNGPQQEDPAKQNLQNTETKEKKKEIGPHSSENIKVFTEHAEKTYIQVGVYLTEDAKKLLNHAVRRAQSSRKAYMEQLLEKAFQEMECGKEPDEDKMDMYITKFKSKKYLILFEMKKRYAEKFAECAAWHYMNKSEFCNYLIMRETVENF